MQTVRQHQEGGCWTSTKKKKNQRLRNRQIYLPQKRIYIPSRTSITNHFFENSQRLKVVNYFRKKAPSQMLVWALNTPLYLIWLTYQKCASAPRKCSLDQHIKNILKSNKILYKQKTTNILTQYGLPITYILNSAE